MANENVRRYGVEPVPARDRTSSPGDQFWIWMGANIAPISWAPRHPRHGDALGLSAWSRRWR